MNFEHYLARLLPIVLLCLCAVLAKNVDTDVHAKKIADGASCENVHHYFSLKNFTVVPGKIEGKGAICNGNCCDDRTEAKLKEQAQKDFLALLRHNSRSLQGLLTSTSATLLNHVSDLTRQSENKTLLLFSQVYRGMAVLSRAPIEKLYGDIRNYIVRADGTVPEDSSPEQIVNGVNLFFTELFPLAYHHSADISGKDFTLDYKRCLKKSTEAISPFGDVPREMAASLSKSLEATRLLLQALAVGTEVLRTTDHVLMEQDDSRYSECHNALTKMTYCPRCRGMDGHAKPCRGYCLNVIRGCIAKYVSELDLPWNGYVEGIESLLSATKKSNNEAGANADVVIRNLDTKISAAIMHYMEKGKDIDARVKRSCGTAEFSVKEDPLVAGSSTPIPTASSGKPRSNNPRNFSPLPEDELSHFLASISKTKSFYANLATTLCEDESFAESKDRQCWNGERIAEYTKMVVDVGLDRQKYNPEVSPPQMTAVNPKVAELVDNLRRVHHMAVSSLGPNYSDADYMQRDGVDGSGSGSGPDVDVESDRDDEYNMRGSGSGDGPGQDETIDDSRAYKPKETVKPTYQNTPTVHLVAGCSSTNPLLAFVLLAATVVLYTKFN